MHRRTDGSRYSKMPPQDGGIITPSISLECSRFYGMEFFLISCEGHTFCYEPLRWLCWWQWLLRDVVDKPVLRVSHGSHADTHSSTDAASTTWPTSLHPPVYRSRLHWKPQGSTCPPWTALRQRCGVPV